MDNVYACAECGHLHFLGNQLGYEECPIEGCNCEGQEWAKDLNKRPVYFKATSGGINEMTFKAVINTTNGEKRTIKFDSIYDARSSLAIVVERDYLQPGESIALLHVGRNVQVPYITRVS